MHDHGDDSLSYNVCPEYSSLWVFHCVRMSPFNVSLSHGTLHADLTFYKGREGGGTKL